MNEITGGSPYSASTLAGPDGRSRQPSENELAIARSQGRYVAEVAAQLVWASASAKDSKVPGTASRPAA
jgi:hypothetical protein